MMERYDRDVGCMGVPAGDETAAGWGLGVKIAVTAGVAVAVLLGAAQVASFGDSSSSGCAGSPLGQQGEGC